MNIEFIVLNKQNKTPITTQRDPIDGDLIYVVKTQGGVELSRSRKTYTTEQFETTAEEE